MFQKPVAARAEAGFLFGRASSRIEPGTIAGPMAAWGSLFCQSGRRSNEQSC
jgi:hypothetical protein